MNESDLQPPDINNASSFKLFIPLEVLLYKKSIDKAVEWRYIVLALPHTAFCNQIKGKSRKLDFYIYIFSILASPKLNCSRRLIMGWNCKFGTFWSVPSKSWLSVFWSPTLGIPFPPHNQCQSLMSMWTPSWVSNSFHASLNVCILTLLNPSLFVLYSLFKVISFWVTW